MHGRPFKVPLNAAWQAAEQGVESTRGGWSLQTSPAERVGKHAAAPHLLGTYSSTKVVL